MRRLQTRRRLQRELGLDVRADAPAVRRRQPAHRRRRAPISSRRLADRIAALPAQLAVLGTGEPALERALARAARAHPRSIATTIGFDERLAHRIEAGADMFLMPSRFEPCGLNQMYSQRYGTPPIARATGGLVDSIVDADAGRRSRTARATGFLFDEATADGVVGGDDARTRAHAQPAQSGAPSSAREWRSASAGRSARATMRRSIAALLDARTGL